LVTLLTGFHVFILLLIMNFIITVIVKVAVDPQGDSRVDLQTYRDEVVACFQHCQGEEGSLF